MKISDLLKISDFKCINSIDEERNISKVYCCDLLSHAMAKAPEDSVWVTIMGNRNVIAVASLCDVSCVVICDGADFDQDAISAASDKLTLLKSPYPIFETGKIIDDVHGKN